MFFRSRFPPRGSDESERRTVDYGLKYEANQKINLEGYVDSDWVGSALQGVALVWDHV